MFYCLNVVNQEGGGRGGRPRLPGSARPAGRGQTAGGRSGPGRGGDAACWAVRRRALCPRAGLGRNARSVTPRCVTSGKFSVS